MLRRGIRLSSAVRSAAARQLIGSPVSAPGSSPGVLSPASSLGVVPEQNAALFGLPASKCLGLPRPFATVAIAPEAASEDLKVELDHATGLEREEILGEIEGKPRFDLAPPTGPFGTVEAPAIIESYFDERLVGCSGGVGEEEHDVVWFKLKKDLGHECSVCGQVFQLKVVGEGGLPGGHH